MSGLSIRRIYIENFRSIRKLSIEAKALTLLVGNNDSGKSNILRALNLFFNNETVPGQHIDFTTDFSSFAVVGANKAKEVVVRLELELPDSYRATNGHFLEWERRWRAGERAPTRDHYRGFNEIPKKRSKRFSRDYLEIPGRSNLHSLLSKVDFKYIPAIKDSQFFEHLRRLIYETIAEVAERNLRTSSESFEKAIGDQLAGLTSDIRDTLNFENKLALPKDLSPIFEKLDFQNSLDSISLERRGDGIKVRHIPIILKYIADRRRELQVRGSMPYTFLWAYEEPENNLELTNCVSLSKNFESYVQDDSIQLFLTTHSPVFYDMAHASDEQFNNKFNCYHVYKDGATSETLCCQDPSDLDNRMGMLALLGPRVKKFTDDIEKLSDRLREAEILASDDRAKIFVEGTTDKAIVDRAIELFFSDFRERVVVETKESGAGWTYVIDMMTAWAARRKHHSELPKAVGLLDKDSEAKTAGSEWNGKSTAHAKCFYYLPSSELKLAFSKGLSPDIFLESTYSSSIWDHAKTKGFLNKKTVTDVFPSQILEKIISEKKDTLDFLDKSFCLQLSFSISQEGKSYLSKHISKKDMNDFSLAAPAIEETLRPIFTYLFGD